MTRGQLGLYRVGDLWKSVMHGCALLCKSGNGRSGISYKQKVKIEETGYEPGGREFESPAGRRGITLAL